MVVAGGGGVFKGNGALFQGKDSTPTDSLLNSMGSAHDEVNTMTTSASVGHWGNGTMMMKVAQVTAGKEGLDVGIGEDAISIPHESNLMMEGLLATAKFWRSVSLGTGIRVINVTVWDEVLALVYCSSLGATATGLADAIGNNDCD